MLHHVAIYALALVVYTTLESTGVMYVFTPLYRSRPVKRILRRPPRLNAAAIFFLIYASGVVQFAVFPALRANDLTVAIRSGAALGAFGYGTFAFTCLAIFDAFSWELAFIDTLWGAFVTAVSAYVTAKISAALA